MDPTLEPRRFSPGWEGASTASETTGPASPSSPGEEAAVGSLNFVGGLFCHFLIGIHVDVSKNKGTPKWMVKIMESLIKMDDFVVPLFSETPRWL